MEFLTLRWRCVELNGHDDDENNNFHELFLSVVSIVGLGAETKIIISVMCHAGCQLARFHMICYSIATFFFASTLARLLCVHQRLVLAIVSVCRFCASGLCFTLWMHNYHMVMFDTSVWLFTFPSPK